MEFLTFEDDNIESQMDEPKIENDFISDLRDWAITNNISQVALDGLLALHRKNNIHGEVLFPKSSKTLLRIIKRLQPKS